VNKIREDLNLFK